MPTAVYLRQEEPSKVVQLLDRLRKNEFVMPANEMLPKYKKEFADNIEKRQERNDFIVAMML